jgi:predicted RNase H-like nuclease (RuvC/YqgF family)
MRLAFLILAVLFTIKLNAQVDTAALQGKWKVSMQQTKDLQIDVTKSGKQIKLDIDSISSRYPELKWTTAQKNEHVKKMKKEASLLRKCNILFKQDGTVISKFLTEDDKVATTQRTYKWLTGNVLEMKSATGETVKAQVNKLDNKVMEVTFNENTTELFTLTLIKQ